MHSAVYLSGPPLEMEVQPYRFKTDLPPTTLSTTNCDTNDGVYHTAFSMSSLVDHIGYTDWKVCIEWFIIKFLYEVLSDFRCLLSKAGLCKGVIG